MYTREQFEGTASFEPGAIAALAEFKRLVSYKPENRELRPPGMQMLLDRLCEVYRVPVDIRVVTDFDDFIDAEPPIGGQHVYPLILSGGFSIIILLNGFARIRQHVNGEPSSFVECQRWTINLFKKVYPEQFERMEFLPESGWYSRPVAYP